MTAGLGASAPPAAGRLPLVARARLLLWHRPEWWALAAAAAAWLVLVAAAVGGGSPGSHTGAHHGDHGGAPTTAGWAGNVAWWVVMVVAMMTPLVVPGVRTVAFNSLWRRRHRAIAAFLAGYLAVWSAVGAVALGALALAGSTGHGSTAVLSGALGLAAAWQLTPSKRRFLRSCHRTMALAPRGLRADLSCARFGAVTGRRCLGSCWAVMAAMAVSGHGVLLMVAVTAPLVAERYRRRPRPAHGAAVLGAMAVVVPVAAAVT